MITVTLNPVIFKIGHFMVRWYSLIVSIAIVTGIWLALREARRKGLGEKHFNDLIVWLIISGILGARLFHVIDHWSDEYVHDPIRVFYVWEGGLAIWGAVTGGFIALALFAWKRDLSLGLLADTGAPGLVLAQGIGRLACIVTGDSVGKVTSGPFGLAYTKPGAMVPELGVYYTPTPVYEIIMNVSIFIVLWRLRKRSLPDGGLFLVYLLLYSGGRFIVSLWSSYKIVAVGLNQAQLISLFSILVGLPWLVYLLRRERATSPA